jgi:hypothetical protein
MNPDIQKALAIIDQRIENLVDIRTKLAEEFGSAPETTRSAPKLLATNTSNGNGSLTRKQQLVAFLTEHGPAKRGKINAESGIPKGTVAALLNKPGFVRRFGKWHVDTSSASQEITH